MCVCKTLFLNTLAISEWSAKEWALSSMDRRSIEPQEKVKPSKKDALKRKSAVEFLDMIPKVDSHYCRKQTTRVYVEPVFRSKTHLYTVYVNDCKEKELPYLRRTNFLAVLGELKISIYKPKKDQCDVCIAHKVGTISEDEYKGHINVKEEARAMKDEAKKNAKHVYVMDIEAVLLCPRTQASAMYFKRKLTVHNFTIYNLKNSDALCYLWDETEADLSADVFASMLCDFVETKITFEEEDEIIFISHGCTYQNRNCIVSNALLHLAISKKVTIIQCYLEKGHTQMECDSCHSSIESRLKLQEVYLPSGYINICRSA